MLSPEQKQTLTAMRSKVLCKGLRGLLEFDGWCNNIQTVGHELLVAFEGRNLNIRGNRQALLELRDMLDRLLESQIGKDGHGIRRIEQPATSIMAGGFVDKDRQTFAIDISRDETLASKPLPFRSRGLRRYNRKDWWKLKPAGV
jgi:hypothetical protein